MTMATEISSESGTSASTAVGTSSRSRSRRLFIGNLHPDITSEDLRQRFGNFGSVQDVDVRNKNDATFAFIEINFNDKENGLKKCIDLFNNTKWKGVTVKVQPAKENFIEKLKKEREQSRYSKKPRPPDNFDFEIITSTSKDNSKSAWLNQKTKDMIETLAKQAEKAQQEQTRSRTKQEQRSSSSKLVQSKAPKVRSPSPSKDKKSIATSAIPKKSAGPVQISSASSSSDSSDEEEERTKKTNKHQLPMFRGILSYQRPWHALALQDAKSEPPSEPDIFPTPPKAAPTPVSGGTGMKLNPMKKLRSEAQRIQGVQTRVDMIKSRADIVRQALSSDNLVRQEREEQAQSTAESKSKETSNSFLFGSGNVDSDEDMDVDAQFRIKPQYEGEAGQRLMELGAKFGGDQRFRLDERFAEEKPTTGEGEALGADAEAEKQTQLNVLSEMFGSSIMASSHGSGSRQMASPLGLVRYQPSSAEHRKKYEIQAEMTRAESAFEHSSPTELGPPEKTKLGKKIKKSKQADTASEQQQTAKVPKPIYKVAPNLKQLFSNETAEGEVTPPKFSLLRSFASDTNATTNDHDDGEGDEEEVEGTSKNELPRTEVLNNATSTRTPTQTPFRKGTKPNPFKYDSSDDDEDGGGSKMKTNVRQDHSDVNIVNNHLNLFKGELFFFTVADPRLAGVLESFMRSDEDLEAVKTQFNDGGGRSELKTIAKAKWKNSKRKSEKRTRAIKLMRKKKRRDAVKKLQHQEKVKAIREAKTNQE